MKFYLILFILIYRVASAENDVRVRLMKDQTQVELLTNDKLIHLRGQGNHHFIIKPKQKAYIKLNSNWIWEINTLKKNILLKGRSLKLTSEGVPLIQNKIVTNHLIFYANKKNLFDIIGLTDIDSYILGVLPHEMPSSWHKEALKAQSVVTRSYALAIMSEREQEPFDLESTIEDQVFYPLHPNLKNSVTTRKILKIIHETKKIILKNLSSPVVKAYYHADCGGETEEASNIWAIKGETLGTTKDKGCPLSPSAKWKTEISTNIFTKKVHQFLKRSEMSKINDIKIISRTPSGRVGELEINLNNQKTSISSEIFRKLIGYQKIKSTKFDIQILKNKIVVTGVGHGHGVGLCQWGSNFLANQGYNFTKILKHYYPNSQLSEWKIPTIVTINKSQASLKKL